MKNIINTVSFLTIFALVPGAFAATPRVSVTGNPTSRIPSIAGHIVSVSGTTGTSTTTGSTTASSLLTNAECIDNYSSCIKAADACGANMEECTTNVLFHAQMPKCLSVLAQCSSSGVNDLFGTSNVSALANVKSTNSAGEVTAYTYPTDGSVLGQMITGAKLANQYDTAQCVKRYTSCVKKDSVCGNDFELCTTPTEFKKQSVFCMSTLARCQSEGLIELFGSTNTTIAPSADSRLGTAISEGAALAAVNAVSTCYKVADQCILNACGSNPNKCIVDSNNTLATIADAINNGKTITTDDLIAATDLVSSSDVSGYIKNSCMDTIGGNKYCYATFIGNGQMPTNAQLRDEDNRDEVFSEAYSARMNSAMKQKIQDLANKFDTRAKDKCSETIKTCAMRSCGGGLGSVCYSLVFGSNGEKSINGKATYGDIKTACEAIVNTDSNCQYAAAATNSALYTYNYIDNSAFTTLFPEYTAGGPDPIGAVAVLNASLSTSYNDAAIAQMKKQCANTAISCVKSMCGTDYVNCYRNRTDVLSNTYNTGAAGFDKSMNKVGGVLDYTIVTGLCINAVKNASVCDEHLKIEAYKLSNPNSDLVSAWGGSSNPRDAWLDSAKGITAVRQDNSVTIGCTSITGGDNCDSTSIEACDYVDGDGCLYDQPVTQTWDEYSVSQSANNLFQEVLMDIEKEAQAKYNAKLTKEQNTCLAQNNGGIVGANENGSTYLWVKLKSNKIPKDYASKGLQTKNYVTSNDLYGSFCRARVTVTSDDKAIQDVLSDKATAYFAVGDTFTCGSWIDQKTLDKITAAVGEQAAKEAGKGSAKEKAALAWSTIGGALGGGALGFFGMDAIQTKGGSLGGLLDGKGISKTQAAESDAKKCLDEVDLARSAYSLSLNGTEANKVAQFSKAIDHANKAKRYARSAGASVSGVDFVPLNGYNAGTAGVYAWSYSLTTFVDNVNNSIQSSTADNKNAAVQAVARAQNILNIAPTSAGDLRARDLYQALNNAVNSCRSIGACQDVSFNVPVLVESRDSDNLVTYPEYISVSVAAQSSSHVTNNDDAYGTFVTNISTVEEACQKLFDGEDEEARKSRRTKNLIAGAATSAIGAALGIGISKTVLDIKYENAANEAVKLWMEEIGDHIQCYIGGEEAGSYGDVVSISFD